MQFEKNIQLFGFQFAKERHVGHGGRPGVLRMRGNPLFTKNKLKRPETLKKNVLSRARPAADLRYQKLSAVQGSKGRKYSSFRPLLSLPLRFFLLSSPLSPLLSAGGV